MVDRFQSGLKSHRPIPDIAASDPNGGDMDVDKVVSGSICRQTQLDIPAT